MMLFECKLYGNWIKLITYIVKLNMEFTIIKLESAGIYYIYEDEVREASGESASWDFS